MNASLLLNQFTTILSQLFPRRCLLCQQVVIPDTYHLPLCQCCYQDLPTFKGYHCDNLLLKPFVAKGLKKPKFDSLVCLAPYGWPFDRWISSLKFRRHVNLAPTLAELLAIQIKKHLCRDNFPEVLVPLPLHRWRQFYRGFNQAQLIANHLAKSLKMPMDNQALKRIKATKAQSGLGKQARNKNVKQAFTYQPTQNYQHVAIVDDVITTGATVNQVAMLLKEAGVAHVSVWCICATIAS